MPTPESSLNEQIQSFMDRSNLEYDNGNYIESVRCLEEAWVLLPEPKGYWDDSFHIVLEITEVYLELNEISKAKEWSEKIFDCALERIDSGQRDYLAGKVAFESGDYETAKKCFMIANQKSRGRCFKKYEPKYLEFFKKEFIK